MVADDLVSQGLSSYVIDLVWPEYSGSGIGIVNIHVDIYIIMLKYIYMYTCMYI